ncbi:MAG: tRNA threonylcarbamoyladenosine biosynthesis protein TsaE [Ktedonobacterales bacterium]|jgi:tRNA threonylcarbamoyladenosine biosynthesis protein TsaE|nr:MAG: tRNA threonylcarbamoyladenosine biosynthesis protein TsaE [Ktedonobacterales bacterium]
MSILENIAAYWKPEPIMPTPKMNSMPDLTTPSGSATTSAPVELQSASVAETRQLGELLGRLLASGDLILLRGNLGAGKTAFTQGVACGLGITAPVNSPTFTVLKEYAGRLPLYHFDLYRIEGPGELFDLGFEDYFLGAGVSIVEWAERGATDDATAAWPNDWLRVTFTTTGPDTRLLRCDAVGERGRALLAAFACAAEDDQRKAG